MSWFETVKTWLWRLTEVGLLLIALSIVFTILFGADVPFIGTGVVQSFTDFVQALGNGGFAGILAAIVIVWLFSKRSLR
ncbi:MAG: hypothetical protein RIE31_07190 [Alphaproteobacteria bacterium]